MLSLYLTVSELVLGGTAFKVLGLTEVEYVSAHEAKGGAGIAGTVLTSNVVAARLMMAATATTADVATWATVHICRASLPEGQLGPSVMTDETAREEGQAIARCLNASDLFGAYAIRVAEQEISEDFLVGLRLRSAKSAIASSADRCK